MESSKGVDSGDLSKPKKRKAAKRRKRRSPKPTRSSRQLSPSAPEEKNVSPSAEEKPSGMLHSITSLFSDQSPSPSEKDSSLDSMKHSPTEPVVLPPDTEAQLRSVPDTIGEELEDEGADESISSDDVRELMEMVAFEEEDVKELLEEFHEFLAEYFESDHWKLTDRRSRMLGRPLTLLVNSLWKKLSTIIPDIIARWCESTPGAMAFISACGIVYVPMGLKQVRLSRARRSGDVPKTEPKNEQRKETETPKRPPAKTAATELGIPSARGVVGG
jgi:hypothetical protein